MTAPVDGVQSAAPRRWVGLSRRFLVFSVGVTLLAAIAAWFGLPLVGVDGRIARAGGMLALVGLVGVALGLAARLRTRAGDRRRFPTDEEQALAAALERPLGLMDRSAAGVRLGAGARYQVPWYLVMGPSGSGKSTLLRSSGLHFPHDDDAWLEARGEGGTEHCDGWLTDQAFFIDTAGRYTTEPAERTGWRALLRLLRSARRRRPVDGVLLTLSARELADAAGSQLRARVRVIRERLGELEATLGVRPPVLLIVTGLDRLAGYPAFMSVSGNPGQSGHWGVATASRTDPGETAQRLQVQAEQIRRRAMLATDTEDTDAAGVLAFIAEMRPLTRGLSEFLRLLLRPDPYLGPPLVQAVHLTGNAPAQPTLSPGLFAEAVVPLARGVRLAPGRRLRRRIAAAALLVGAVGIVALIGYRTAELYQQRLAQSAAVAEGVAEATESMAAGSGEPGAALRALQRLQGLEADLGGSAETGLGSALALDPGRGPIQGLSRGLHELSVTVAGEGLLPDAVDVLRQRLEALVEEWPEWDAQERAAHRAAYREVVEAWVRLVDGVDGEGSVADLLAGLVADERGAGAQEGQTSLVRGLSRALAEPSQWEAARERLDTAAGRERLEQARKHLRTPARTEAVKERMLAGAAADLPPLELEAIAPGTASAVWATERPVAGVFRGEAWESRLQPALEEVVDELSHPDLVLGRDEKQVLQAEQARALAEAVEARYLRAFVDHWLEWLGSLRWRSAEDLRERARQLDKAAEGGALAALLEGIHAHLGAHVGQDPAAVLDRPPAQALGGYRHDPRGLQLVALMAPDEDDEVAPLAEVARALAKVADRLEGVSSAADPGAGALECAVEVLQGEEDGCSLRAAEMAVAQALRPASGAVEQALEPLLLGGVDAAWDRLREGVAAELNERWRAQVVEGYRDRLAGRFPLDAEGADAALADFEAFFAPDQGALWQFKAEHLAPFLRGRDAQGGERQWRGAGLGIATEAREAYHTAAQIRDGLFDDAGQARLRYRVSPEANADLTDMRWESEGKSLRYHNGPPVSADLRWPRSTPRPARITAVSTHESTVRSIEADGPWALFRLLRRADEREQVRSNAVRAQWSLRDGGEARYQPVTFLLQTERSTPLLHWGDLTRFHLPERVIGEAGS